MDNNSVYIHIAAPEKIQAGTIAPLNVAERTRAENFMHAKDRQLYTAAHIFLVSAKPTTPYTNSQRVITL